MFTYAAAYLIGYPVNILPEYRVDTAVEGSGGGVNTAPGRLVNTAVVVTVCRTVTVIVSAALPTVSVSRRITDFVLVSVAVAVVVCVMTLVAVTVATVKGGGAATWG